MKIADKWSRFVNNVLDTIGFFFLIMLHAFVLDGLLHVIPEEGSPLLALYTLILYFGYHFLFEYFFYKTPAKFLTKTKVTDAYGNRPTTKALLIRNLCRLIPFDNFSFLLGDKGWHDSISETEVSYI
jgi:uncharacterized RDD family membrane protein YckC